MPEKGLHMKYFVLKIDGSDKAAMEALKTYADRTDNHLLRHDLYDLYYRITDPDGSSWVSKVFDDAQYTLEDICDEDDADERCRF